MSNEIISRFMGECRHVGWQNETYDEMAYTWMMRCPECGGLFAQSVKFRLPDYENDPGAWTQELFGEIKEADLHRKMIAHMINAVEEAGGDFIETHEEINNGSAIISVSGWDWILSASTPAQKAEALSRAIMEIK